MERPCRLLRLLRPRRLLRLLRPLRPRRLLRPLRPIRPCRLICSVATTVLPSIGIFSNHYIHVIPVNKPGFVITIIASRIKMPSFTELLHMDYVIFVACNCFCKQNNSTNKDIQNSHFSIVYTYTCVDVTRRDCACSCLIYDFFY